MKRKIGSAGSLAFAKRIIAHESARLDAMLVRIPVPAGTLILTSDINPYDMWSENPGQLAGDLAALSEKALRDNRTILLLCSPERNETVADAVRLGFRIHVVHLLHAPGDLYGLPGRAKKILRDKEGVFTAFASDIDEAEYLRDTLAALPAPPALSSVT